MAFSNFAAFASSMSVRGLRIGPASSPIKFKAFLTGIGVYDRIGKFAGGGSIVPITGFANSVVSPSIEYKTEGYVYGTASKMFTIAGPIIVFGVAGSVLVGILYYAIYAIF